MNLHGYQACCGLNHRSCEQKCGFLFSIQDDSMNRSKVELTFHGADSLTYLFIFHKNFFSKFGAYAPVFTGGLFPMQYCYTKKDTARFSSSTFVLFKSDIRFSSSAFVLFILDVRSLRSKFV